MKEQSLWGDERTRGDSFFSPSSKNVRSEDWTRAPESENSYKKCPSDLDLNKNAVLSAI